MDERDRCGRESNGEEMMEKRKLPPSVHEILGDALSSDWSERGRYPQIAQSLWCKTIMGALRNFEKKLIKKVIF